MREQHESGWMWHLLCAALCTAAGVFCLRTPKDQMPRDGKLSAFPHLDCRALVPHRRYMKWVLFGLYGWWLPQIVLSALGDSRQPLRPAYIIGTSAARLALPLYLCGIVICLSQARDHFLCDALLVMSFNY